MDDLIVKLESEGGEITPRRCWFCDFGLGMRGMDRCAKCDGTGSVFVIPGPQLFPNTKQGYLDALRARSKLK